MLTVYPDYYKKFNCIKGECHHNCCIGWEIDIDCETATYYKSVGGEMGQKLGRNINWCESPHFILSDNERCPFLNEDNLCDIIIELGEDKLCGICDDHPRFKNELPDRLEIGLGLCCEAAAKLILSQAEPMKLEYIGQSDIDDEIIGLRDKVIDILQDREFDIKTRIDKMLDTCYASTHLEDISVWAERLKGFEVLDKKWSDLIDLLEKHKDHLDLDAFDRHMASRQTEYEQLLVYFIYRHLANAPDAQSVSERASFAVFGYNLIRWMGAVILEAEGRFDLEHQIELARLFSSEIEYSDENFYILLDSYL